MTRKNNFVDYSFDKQDIVACVCVCVCCYL
jgi:hypothetical protein